MRIVFRLDGPKAYPIDAIAQRMVEFDPTIVPFAHLVYITGTETESYVKNGSKVNYRDSISTLDIFERYKTDKLDMDFLKEAEKKYAKPNFWNIVYHERLFNPYIHWNPGTHIYTESELLRWLQATIKHIEHVISSMKPDVYIDCFTMLMLRTITRLVCKYHGVKWLAPVNTRFKDTACIADNAIDYRPALEQNYQKMIEDESTDLSTGYMEIKQFREKNKTAYNLVNVDLTWTKTVPIGYDLKKFFRLKWLRHLFLEVHYQLNKKDWKVNYRKGRPLDFLTYKLKYQYNKVMVRLSGIPETDYNKETPYFLFTLCTIPEEATEVRGPFFSDEIFIVKTIVKSLPVDCQLYVKEHSTMYYKRSFRFYKELARIPKVKVLSPYCNIVDLIKNSQGVITIGGTIGFEAVIYGKPLIVFGHALYNFLDFVYKIKDITELPYVMQKARSYQADERKIAAFFQSIVETSFSFPFTLFENVGIGRKPGIEQFLVGDEGEYIKRVAKEFIKYLHQD